MAPGDLGGTAHKLFGEPHQGDKIGGDKVLKKTNLEDNDEVATKFNTLNTCSLPIHYP